MLAYLVMDKIRRRSKVMPYVRYQSCRAGSQLRGSEIHPGQQSSVKSYVSIPTQIHVDFGQK
eukprot:9591976-Ditylum_brightwellii.AAC.1